MGPIQQAAYEHTLNISITRNISITGKPQRSQDIS